jgi:hypothetical protein
VRRGHRNVRGRATRMSAGRCHGWCDHGPDRRAAGPRRSNEERGRQGKMRDSESGDPTGHDGPDVKGRDRPRQHSGEGRIACMKRTIEVEVLPPGLDDSPARRPRAHLANLRGWQCPCSKPNRPMSPIPVVTSPGRRIGWSTLTVPFLSSGCLSMRNAAFASEIAMTRSDLRLHIPAADMAGSVRWLIDGFPATILIWTAEEWARLTERPDDAQECPNGIWCALRIE